MSEWGEIMSLVHHFELLYHIISTIISTKPPYVLMCIAYQYNVLIPNTGRARGTMRVASPHNAPPLLGWLPYSVMPPALSLGSRGMSRGDIYEERERAFPS